MTLPTVTHFEIHNTQPRVRRSGETLWMTVPLGPGSDSPTVTLFFDAAAALEAGRLLWQEARRVLATKAAVDALAVPETPDA